MATISTNEEENAAAATETESVSCTPPPQTLHTLNNTAQTGETTDIMNTTSGTRTVQTIPNKPNMTNIQPNQNDVLGGKGSHMKNHPGNSFYRTLIQQHKQSYNPSLTNEEKATIATHIIHKIRQLNPPGRFLSYQGKKKVGTKVGTSTWVEMDAARVPTKILQALRDCNDAYDANEVNEYDGIDEHVQEDGNVQEDVQEDVEDGDHIFSSNNPTTPDNSNNPNSISTSTNLTNTKQAPHINIYPPSITHQVHHDNFQRLAQAILHAEQMIQDIQLEQKQEQEQEQRKVGALGNEKDGTVSDANTNGNGNASRKRDRDIDDIGTNADASKGAPSSPLPSSNTNSISSPSTPKSVKGRKRNSNSPTSNSTPTPTTRRFPRRSLTKQPDYRENNKYTYNHSKQKLKRRSRLLNKFLNGDVNANGSVRQVARALILFQKGVGYLKKEGEEEVGNEDEMVEVEKDVTMDTTANGDRENDTNADMKTGETDATSLENGEEVDVKKSEDSSKDLDMEIDAQPTSPSSSSSPASSPTPQRKKKRQRKPKPEPRLIAYPSERNQYLLEVERVSHQMMKNAALEERCKMDLLQYGVPAEHPSDPKNSTTSTSTSSTTTIQSMQYDHTEIEQVASFFQRAEKILDFWEWNLRTNDHLYASDSFNDYICQDKHCKWTRLYECVVLDVKIGATRSDRSANSVGSSSSESVEKATSVESGTSNVINNDTIPSKTSDTKNDDIIIPLGSGSDDDRQMYKLQPNEKAIYVHYTDYPKSYDRWHIIRRNESSEPTSTTLEHQTFTSTSSSTTTSTTNEDTPKLSTKSFLYPYDLKECSDALVFAKQNGMYELAPLPSPSKIRKKRAKKSPASTASSTNGSGDSQVSKRRKKRGAKTKAERSKDAMDVKSTEVDGEATKSQEGSKDMPMSPTNEASVISSTNGSGDGQVSLHKKKRAAKTDKSNDAIDIESMEVDGEATKSQEARMTPTSQTSIMEKFKSFDRRKEYRDRVWNKRLKELQSYKKQNGNCEVPTMYRPNQ